MKAKDWIIFLVVGAAALIAWLFFSKRGAGFSSPVASSSNTAGLPALLFGQNPNRGSSSSSSNFVPVVQASAQAVQTLAGIFNKFQGTSMNDTPTGLGNGFYMQGGTVYTSDGAIYSGPILGQITPTVGLNIPDYSGTTSGLLQDPSVPLADQLSGITSFGF